MEGSLGIGLLEKECDSAATCGEIGAELLRTLSDGDGAPISYGSYS